MDNARQVTGNLGEATRGRVDQISPRERAGHAGEMARHIADKGKVAAKEAPQKVDTALQWSREQRLATEQKNANRSLFQKVMGKTVGRVVVKTIATGFEMLPSPWLYGPGDVLTAANAITGRNLMTGEHLDPVERVIHGVAAAIPVIPATPVVEASRFVRRGIENAAHARRQQSVKDLQGGARDIQQGVSGFRQIVKDVRSAKPPGK